MEFHEVGGAADAEGRAGDDTHDVARAHQVLLEQAALDKYTFQRDAYLQFINPTDVTSPAKRQAAIDHLPDSGRRLLFDDGRFQVWSPIGA